jgi:hypothetical protein
MQKQTVHYTVDEFSSTTSKAMPVEGDVQGSRVRNLGATLGGHASEFLDIRHSSRSFW